MKAISRYIKEELKPYRGRIVVYVFIFGTIYSGLKSLILPSLNMLAEKGWEQKDSQAIIVFPILIGLNFIVHNIFRYFHTYKTKFTAEEIALNLRKQLLKKYLSLDLSFFQEQDSGAGGLISRIMNDINEIQNGLQKVADMIREPITAFFVFCYMIYLDWALTLSLMVTMPLVTAILKNLGRSVHKYSHRSFEALETLTKTIKETLDGIRVIQSFNLQKEMNKRFEVESEHFLEQRSKIISREEFSSPISEIIASLALTFLLIYVGYQTLDGKMSSATLFTYFTSIFMLSDAIRKTQIAYVRLQTTSSALERVYQVIERTNTIKETDSPLPFPENWKTIEFKDVSLKFGEREVLKNINLKINRGEVIALVGSSGGGKSSLVNLLERFFDPTEGEILIDQVPIQQMRLSDLRKHISLVTQDVFLFGDSIKRNIHSGDFEKPEKQVYEAAKLANAHEFIEKTEHGYDSRAGDLGGLLSGGEKQRISIARALLKDAPILILDEATSALDSKSEKEVQKGLDHLIQKRTAFVIAHRLSTIVNADRIIVLNEGQIVEQGAHSELLQKQGSYFNLHQLQQS